MISAAFTNRFTRYLPIIIIITAGAFLRLYKISQAFPFDHDQEVAANAAFIFFTVSKLTLIGQELSFGGFFLGPLHNWVGFIPYGICNLQPDCVPYFYSAIGLLTAIIIYLVAKAIFDTKAAFVTGLIYVVSFVAIGFERGASSNYFLTLSSIGLLFCLYQFFKGKSYYLIFGAIVAGLASVNFNPVFIFSSVAFFLSSLLAKSKDLKLYLFAILAFLINYLPLVIFNFRHENILVTNLNNFLVQNAADSQFFERFIYLVKSVAVPFYSNYLFHSASPPFTVLAVVAIIFGLYYLVKNREKFLVFLPIWLVTTLVGFTFYKGPIPDYYFMQTVIPAIIAVSIFATRNLIFFIVFLSLFLSTNFKAAQNYSTIINYEIKKQAVDYIISDSDGKSFNVYYDFPPGLNTGYDYLFKIASNQPTEGGRNLYVLELRDHTDILKYRNSFLGKNVEVKTIGFVNIVSVK